MFLSSTQPGGNLGGVAGADALCQALATTASLPGTFMAWLSDSASSPADRFTRSHDLPYVRVDGAVVATNWNDLTDGALNCPIDKSELGQSVYLPTGPYVTTVFSNTLTDGNPGLTSPQGAPSTCYGSTTCHCYDWTSDDSTGSPHLDPPGSAVGSVFHWTQSGSSQVASDWTDYSFLNGCGLNSSSIYCFEQ